MEVGHNAAQRTSHSDSLTSSCNSYPREDSVCHAGKAIYNEGGIGQSCESAKEQQPPVHDANGGRFGRDVAAYLCQNEQRADLTQKR